jgi:hypothetical protein
MDELEKHLLRPAQITRDKACQTHSGKAREGGIDR